MIIDKAKIDSLNEMLKEVQEDKEGIVKVLLTEVCPDNEGECDPQLLHNKDAVNCPYFTLCNVLCSYSMQSDKERIESEKLVDKFYEIVSEKQKSKDCMYS